MKRIKPSQIKDYNQLTDRENKLKLLRFIEWRMKEGDFDIKSLHRCLRPFHPDEISKAKNYFEQIGFGYPESAYLALEKIIADKIQELKGGN